MYDTTPLPASQISRFWECLKILLASLALKITFKYALSFLKKVACALAFWYACFVALGTGLMSVLPTVSIEWLPADALDPSLNPVSNGAVANGAAASTSAGGAAGKKMGASSGGGDSVGGRARTNGRAEPGLEK